VLRRALCGGWLAAWNAHDLPRILSHYAEDFVMASPRIVDVAGEPSGRLKGKAAVAAYWAPGLGPGSKLRFEAPVVLPAGWRCAIATIAGRRWSRPSSSTRRTR